MPVSYLCKSCGKLIRENENSLHYNLCDTWIHLECIQLHFIDYKKFENQTEPPCCSCCNSTMFPFGKLNDRQFREFLFQENNMKLSKIISNDKNI